MFLDYIIHVHCCTGDGQLRNPASSIGFGMLLIPKPRRHRLMVADAIVVDFRASG